MSGDEKLNKAKSLTETFAAQLLLLNGGKAIPRTWKNHLLKSLKPQPGNGGRPRDYANLEKIVEALALTEGKASMPRTKHHNPGTIKNAIAKKVGVSRKTVDRVAAEMPFDKIAEMPADKRRAYIEGMAGAIHVQLKADDAAEAEATKQANLRRMRRR